LKRKGIIAAAGSGTRLLPMTKVTSKHLLPVYDKPLIYYPLTTLMLAGIDEVLLVCNPHEKSFYEVLLGDGTQWGINVSYASQSRPDGIAQTLIIAETFLDGAPSLLILGDNIFYGDGLSDVLQSISKKRVNTIMSCKVADPTRYGVIEFEKNNVIRNIIEKPSNPPSSYVVPGLYFYTEEAINIAKKLKKSLRGEIEITQLNQHYLKEKKLECYPLGRGVSWFDAGTPDSLLEASIYVKTIEERHDIKIACPEEVAFNLGLIDQKMMETHIHQNKGNSLGTYLSRLFA
jgi:glucose-1-phosphate thymidylyltransferase